jgi:O-succinylbenzoate synthase
LLGGFSKCDSWISAAEKAGVDWWATSALESNIGLSHIAQWVSSKNNPLYQGLGTGALYRRNFPSYTRISADTMWYIHSETNSLTLS